MVMKTSRKDLAREKQERDRVMGKQTDSFRLRGAVIYCSSENGCRKDIDVQKEIIIGRDPRRADIVLNDPYIADIHCLVRLDADSGLYAVRKLTSAPVLLEKEVRQENGWSFIPQGSRIAMGKNQEHVFMMGPVGHASDTPGAAASIRTEKHKIRKWIPAAGAAAAAAAVIFICLGVFFFSNSPQAKFRKLMDQGAKYLAEMNYEEALLAFKHAWELEPRAEVMERVVETYVAWSDALEQEGDLQGASECCLEAWSETTRLGMTGSRAELQESTSELAEKLYRQDEETGIQFMKKLSRETDVFTEEEKPSFVQDYLELLHQRIRELIEAGDIDQAVELQKECLENNPGQEELKELTDLYEYYKEYSDADEAAAETEEYRQKLEELLDYLETHKEEFRYDKIENYDETIQEIREKISQLEDGENSIAVNGNGAGNSTAVNGGGPPNSGEIPSLYYPLLDMFCRGISTGWAEQDYIGGDDLLDPDNVSYMWKNMTETTLNDAGYFLADLNEDGIPELVIATYNRAETGVFYDLYTIYDNKIVHLASMDSETHYYFYLGRSNYIINHISAGADVKGDTACRIENGELKEAEFLGKDHEEFMFITDGGKTETKITEQQYEELKESRMYGVRFPIVSFAEYLQKKGSIRDDSGFRPILDMFYSNIRDGWKDYDDSDETVSYLWWHYNQDSGLQNTGYALIDIDQDGTPELFVSTTEPGDQNTWFDDLYGIVDGRIVHYASGGERYGFQLTKDGRIHEDASGGAMVHYDSLYRISAGTGELVLEEVLARDEYKDSRKPWFHGSDLDHLHPVSEAEFDRIWAYMTDVQVIHYTPFSEYRPSP